LLTVGRRRLKMRNDGYGAIWSSKTGAVSIAYGIWIITSLVLTIFTFFTSLTSVLYFSTNYLQTLYAALLPLYRLTIVVDAISVGILVVFGYGCVRVGGAYSFPSLTLAGAAWMASSIVSMGPAVMALSQADIIIAGGTFSIGYATTQLLFSLMNFAVGLVAAITIIVASFQIQNRTGINAFTAAAALFIVGIFISYVNIGSFIAFGVGLRTLASHSQGVARAPQQPAIAPAMPIPSKGVRLALFCPYCGARAGAGDRFCRSCGSSLKQD
jgi:hypothetical protein